MLIGREAASQTYSSSERCVKLASQTFLVRQSCFHHAPERKSLPGVGNIGLPVVCATPISAERKTCYQPSRVSDHPRRDRAVRTHAEASLRVDDILHSIDHTLDFWCILSTYAFEALLPFGVCRICDRPRLVAATRRIKSAGPCSLSV